MAWRICASTWTVFIKIDLRWYVSNYSRQTTAEDKICLPWNVRQKSDFKWDWNIWDGKFLSLLASHRLSPHNFPTKSLVNEHFPFTQMALNLSRNSPSFITFLRRLATVFSHIYHAARAVLEHNAHCKKICNNSVHFLVVSEN